MATVIQCLKSKYRGIKYDNYTYIPRTIEMQAKPGNHKRETATAKKSKKSYQNLAVV